MASFVFVSSLLLVLSSTVFAPNPSGPDYYWHDYRGGDPGSIPSVFKLNVSDTDGQPIYIGQVYVHNYGIFVAKIKNGLDPVEVAAYGVKKQTLKENLVKVLCATPEDQALQHDATSTSTFYQDIADKLLIPIPGGFDHVSGDSGILDIGIASFGGQIEVGSIRAFDRKEPYLTIAFEGEEVRVDDFRVLVLKHDPENFE